MNKLDEIINRLENAKDHARVTYEADKQNGAPGSTLEYDVGRYDGLKEALEIISKGEYHGA